ncbi:unnamed protein product [Cylindrotheca closterium]|uniref:Protein SYS1 homolog n=1 Tax=Cylindrotheca closterium TaxID=2856 RepID=A0AAD2FXG0_9STRA|nr:unnamed protein product [Cylindrotheca closterium]
MPGRRNGRRGGSGLGFNPRLIFSQICALQCYHYLLLGLLLELNKIFYGTSITIERIFTDNYVKVFAWRGWSDISAILLSSLMGSVLLAIIVEKSKKCLDFSVTLFLIHVVLCTIYDGMPATWDWWVVHILGLIIMTLFGEYLCARKELDEIPLLQL